MERICDRCRAVIVRDHGREIYRGTKLLHDPRTCGPLRVPRIRVARADR